MRFRLCVTALLLAGCSFTDSGRQAAESFTAGYDSVFQRLLTEAQEADWQSQTRIVEGDTMNAARTRAAKEALAGFVGSEENIRTIRGILADRGRLPALLVRELEAMLYLAAESPATEAELVRQRIAAETEQTEKLYGFNFKLGGRPITPNRIDELLRSSTDLAEREAVWQASKEVGPVLKPGLIRLRELRNGVVQSLGYPDFFSYQVSDYGMSSSEMLALMDALNRELRPLYRELHTWARYELARRYDAPVPDLLPAHWLPNRWGQDWSALVSVEGLDVSGALGDKEPAWVVQAAEDFYRSLGFPSLPPSFYQRSSLYPVPADSGYKKNTHASAWHLDLDRDVRSLMSVEPNAEWYETTHHELGHVYYFLAYSRPEVPLVLRQGANRAYHEGIGSMMGLASMQRAFLAGRGLIPADVRVDPIQQQLQEALNFVVFIPFSAGTMTRFEHALYADSLSPDHWNATWWELARRYQGIVPPRPRDESFADGLTKTHINDDPAQYYDYALSYAILFQLHDHIAREILKQDPHDTDYYGHKEVGNFLRSIMAPGASRPWREVLRETTGRTLDAQAIVSYFDPLYQWLLRQNAGRQATLPDL